ncbi:phospholipase C/P1 nuclease domain-containing protein [Apodospora peruviana]|uniref:Phospholipase C/P1 nuclease domain-containing protein n=1 Tax=Apodospora peruviana TaxID=516989 RepID=A0AAE0MGV7_9PEZI|nr:phospholipase C/P1 nuclease domain-containing protein [Apodospora peruviana]
MKLSPLISGLAALPMGALAWGGFGHITVAYVASNFVSSETSAYFQNLLRNHTQDYLSGVATWADSVRYTKWGHFSGPLHYIDAKDSPPTYCGIVYERDCKQEGCVVSAIQNYTSQLLDPELHESARLIAAKFIIHFVGDIHQPLHTEDVAKGGNGILVKFDDVKLNLHHVWDTSIAEKLVSGGRVSRQPYGEAKRWADALTAEINDGKFNVSSRSWLEGVDLADPIATALRWAIEGNEHVCTTVLPRGPDEIRNQELGGGTEYLLKAAPVVELQIAKAGYRLAAWLNLIAAAIAKSEREHSTAGDL